MSIENINDQTKESFNKAENLESDEVFLTENEQQDMKDALNQAEIRQEENPEKIAAVSEDIKEFKSPEELGNEIKELQEEYKMKKEAYQAFTHITSTDTGMGGLGSLSVGSESPESLEKKFPGISGALELMKIAKKKNKVGLKFWKNPELGDFEAQVIKNYLTTGSMGRFTSSKSEFMAKKALDKFMSENNDSGMESGNVKKAIWGDKDASYYESAIVNLNEKLAKLSESK